VLWGSVHLPHCLWHGRGENRGEDDPGAWPGDNGVEPSIDPSCFDPWEIASTSVRGDGLLVTGYFIVLVAPDGHLSRRNGGNLLPKSWNPGEKLSIVFFFFFVVFPPFSQICSTFCRPEQGLGSVLEDEGEP
jgi:hypothetical protein